MARYSSFGVKTVASGALAALLVSSFVPAAHADESPAPTPVVDHGGLFEGANANMHHASFGTEDGRSVAYQVSNTKSPDAGYVTLTVVDYVNDVKLRSRVLEGVKSVERVHTATDGNVYFSANKGGSANALWQYSPVTKKVREVATNAFYSRQITSDDNGVVYMAGHGGDSKAQLVKYDPKTDVTENIAIEGGTSARGTIYHDGIVYVTISGGDERYIATYDVATGTVDKLENSTLSAESSALAVAGHWLVVHDSGSKLSFYNIAKKQWLADDAGKLVTTPSVALGESDERNGKILTAANNTFRIVDGSNPDTVTVTDTGLRFATNTVRGYEWVGTEGNTLVTVQNSGHISEFNLDNKTEKLAQPHTQKPSHSVAGLGMTDSGNLFASSGVDTSGVIYNPTSGSKSARAGLGRFVESINSNLAQYMLMADGTVARTSVEGGGTTETVYTPAEGNSFSGLTAATSGPIVSVDSAAGASLVAINPTNFSTTDIALGKDYASVSEGVALGDLTYFAATAANGDVDIVAVSWENQVVRTFAVKNGSAVAQNVSGLSTPDGSALWLTVGDAVAKVNLSTGALENITDFAAVSGSKVASDSKEAKWYGTSLYVSDEGGIVEFDSSAKQVAVAVKSSEEVTSWELVAGVDKAGLYFLSSQNVGNLFSQAIEFDPNAGGSAPEDIGDIQVSIPGLEFGDEIGLGVPVPIATIIDVAYGTLNGRTVGYTATSSDGSLFNVIDVETNTNIKTAMMDTVFQVWKIEIAPNGNVYIGAIGRNAESQQRGELWIYNPSTEEMKFAGVVPGSSSVWSMVVDEQSNAYIGTYKTGEVVKYTAATGEFTQWDQVEGQEYVRSIEYHDGYVYAGTGTKGTVVKIDVNDPTKRERISDPLLEIFGVEELPWAYDMQIVGKWLITNFTGDLSAAAFYNLETGEWSSNVLGKQIEGTPTTNGSPGFTQLKERNGKIYLTNNGALFEIDLNGDQPVFKSTEIPFAVGIRGQAWVDLSALGYEGEWLVTGTRQGPMRALNIETKQNILLPSQVQTETGTPLHSMELNAQGNLYFVTYPAANGAEYNTNTGQYQRFAAEQAESMLTVGDTTYWGMYPGGYLETVVKNADDKPVIKKLIELGNDQDRPYHMVEEDGKIYIGSIPGYEKHNGALSIYDIATGDLKVIPGIVENQSPVGLAVKDGIVWGSTTVVGGLGANPIASEAKLFKYNANTGEKIGEYELDLPGGQSPKHISALSFGPDGNLWGTTDGYIFALNPDTMQIIADKTVNLYPEVTRYGQWRPMSFEWYNNLLFINVASRLTVINTETMEYRQISDKGEQLSRFRIAALAPEVAAEATAAFAEEGSIEGKEVRSGIYFFGDAAADKLRVYPLLETSVEPAPEPEPEPQPVVKVVKSTSKVKISGKAVYGSTLKATSFKWNTTKVTNKYQWYANGKAIKNATKKTLTMSKPLVGKRISVKVTASKSGYKSGSTTSAQTAKVAKFQAVVSGALSKTTVKKNSSLYVRVKVKSSAITAPTGTVYVKVGTKTVSAKMTAKNKGTVRVKVSGSKLKVGNKQTVRTAFKPTGTTSKYISTSKSTYVGKLSVKR